MTRREVEKKEKKKMFSTSPGGRGGVRARSDDIFEADCPHFNHDSGVIPNFSSPQSQRGTDCPSSVNCEPRTHKGAGVFFISELGGGEGWQRQKLLVNLFARLL